MTVYGLIWLVRIGVLEGDTGHAAYLAGVAGRLLAETGVGLLPRARSAFTAAQREARDALGDDASRTPSRRDRCRLSRKWSRASWSGSDPAD